MSASTFDPRERARSRRMAKARKPDRPNRPDDSERAERDGWIGVDFGSFAATTKSRTFVPLLMLALAMALGVASLRIDLIRTRYALARAMESEQELIEEQRALIVRKRQLNDPAMLATLARERGFRPAEIVMTVPDPSPRSSEPALPDVAAASPTQIALEVTP